MTTHPDLDAIAALDWQEITCQCPCHPRGCPNRATHSVAIHALHACNTPGLDPFGNRVEIRCTQCVAKLYAEIAHKLAQVNAWTRGECYSCGAPMITAGDILRSVSPL